MASPSRTPRRKRTAAPSSGHASGPESRKCDATAAPEQADNRPSEARGRISRGDRRVAGLPDASYAERLRLVKKLGIPSVQASRPQNLKLLKSEGLDAYLRVATTLKSLTGEPESVEVKLLSTHDPAQFIQFVWNNGWGIPGSLADAVARVDQSEAAAEIAAEIVRRLALAPSPKR